MKIHSFKAVKTFKLTALSLQPIDEGQRKKEAHIRKCIQREIEFLREMTFCENVITLEEVLTNEEGIHLVLRFAQHGSLLRHILEHQGGMEEERIRKVMMQLLLTADMLHRKGIYHRDLKPENILILDKSDL